MSKFVTKIVQYVIMAFLLAIGSGLVACQKREGAGKLKIYEDVDFQYHVLDENVCSCGIKEKHIGIIGLTELGKSKEILIVPKQIDGYIVEHLGYKKFMSSAGHIESQKLKRFYVSENQKFDNMYTFFDSKTEETPANTPANINLEKIVIQYNDTSVQGYNGKVYNRKSYILQHPDFHPSSAGYWRTEFSYTNVSYWLNFETEKNGLFWVDDFDYGSLITYIPENPVRDGYIFYGWYKEPECINLWDFKTDILPQSQYNSNNEKIHIETKLYAKWVRNEEV